MTSVIALILLAILLLLVTLVLALFSSLGVALIGWVVSLIFPLSVFEGAILGLVASLGAGYVLVRLISTVSLPWDTFDEEGDEDEWGDEDDEWEPPVVPRRRRQPESPAKPKPTKRKRDR